MSRKHKSTVQNALTELVPVCDDASCAHECLLVLMALSMALKQWCFQCSEQKFNILKGEIWVFYCRNAACIVLVTVWRKLSTFGVPRKSDSWTWRKRWLQHAVKRFAFSQVSSDAMSSYSEKRTWHLCETLKPRTSVLEIWTCGLTSVMWRRMQIQRVQWLESAPDNSVLITRRNWRNDPSIHRQVSPQECGHSVDGLVHVICTSVKATHSMMTTGAGKMVTHWNDLTSVQVLTCWVVHGQWGYWKLERSSSTVVFSMAF